MSTMNINKKALDEIAEAARNLIETAKRNGADLYFAFGSGGPPEDTGLYAVPSGQWKRINVVLATKDEDENSLTPSQSFSKVPVDFEYLDEQEEALLDLDP